MATEGNAEVLDRAKHVRDEIRKGKILGLALAINDHTNNGIGYAEGNADCLKLIDAVIAEMEKGVISSFVYTLNDTVRNGIDWIGIQGHPEYQMIAGCYALMDRIRKRQTTDGIVWLNTGSVMSLAGMLELIGRINRQMWDRHPPERIQEVANGADPSTVVYHHPNLTLGYDFLPWILAREMDRVRRKAPPLKVYFVASRQLSPKDNQMAENVCLPLVKMIGAEMATGKPPANALWYPTNCMEEVVEMVNEGCPVPELIPAPWAMEAMASYRGVVTITLREAEHWTARNSVEDDWREIAYRLRDDLGETVVIVRDTAKADEPFHGFLTVPIASKDLECRAALYRQAKCNLFVANGPSNVDWFCGATPSLAFTPLEDDPDIPESAVGLREYKCSQLAWWKPNNGIEAKTQYPFFKGPRKHKKLVWKWPSVETVMKEYEEHMNAIQVESAGKVGVHPGGKKGARRHEKGRPVAGGNGQEEIARAS